MFGADGVCSLLGAGVWLGVGEGAFSSACELNIGRLEDV